MEDISIWQKTGHFYFALTGEYLMRMWIIVGFFGSEPKALETKFQADIGLPLFGVVTDRRGEAADKRVTECSARS
jgi:hypothetical protein